jgi:hypothetical protein
VTFCALVAVFRVKNIFFSFLWENIFKVKELSLGLSEKSREKYLSAFHFPFLQVGIFSSFQILGNGSRATR